MFKVATDKSQIGHWNLRVDRHNLDGTVTQIAFFRDSERALANAVVAFLNATAAVSATP